MLDRLLALDPAFQASKFYVWRSASVVACYISLDASLLATFAVVAFMQGLERFPKMHFAGIRRLSDRDEARTLHADLRQQYCSIISRRGSCVR